MFDTDVSPSVRFPFIAVHMYIVAIGWLFVVILMGAAEAMDSSVVGGVMTIIFYGFLPLGIVLYLTGTPGRARRRRAIALEHLETERAAQQFALAPSEMKSDGAVDLTLVPDVPDMTHSDVIARPSAPMASFEPDQRGHPASLPVSPE